MKNDFEYHVNKLIKHINLNKTGFGWKNHPNRLHTGQYVKNEGEPFDYLIITNKKIYAFDCKETHSETYKILEKDIRQAYNLLACTISENVDAFFLIYFYKQKNYKKLKVELFFKILEERKHIKYSDCEFFKLENV